MKAKIAESQSTTETRLSKMEAKMMKIDEHIESKIGELRSEIQGGQQKTEALLASLDAQIKRLAGLQVADAAPAHGLTPAAPVELPAPADLQLRER